MAWITLSSDTKEVVDDSIHLIGEFRSIVIETIFQNASVYIII